MRHRIHYGHPRLSKHPLEARSDAIAVGSIERGQAGRVVTGSLRLEPREQLSVPMLLVWSVTHVPGLYP